MKMIFDRKDMFTIANLEDARKYINCEGYFCDSYYLDLNRWDKGILKEVNEDTTDYPFYLKPRNNCSNASFGFRFFLPVDKVKGEKKKKWRAFTLEEFNKTIPMGTVFKYRYKSRDGSDNRYVKSIYYHANLDCENGYQAIFFEDCCFNLGHCFEVMELFLNGKWQPFGVLENE